MIFWIPTVASGIALLAGLLLQIVGGTFSPGWAVGLALQTALAVVLAIRWKLG